MSRARGRLADIWHAKHLVGGARGGVLGAELRFKTSSLSDGCFFPRFFFTPPPTRRKFPHRVTGAVWRARCPSPVRPRRAAGSESQVRGGHGVGPSAFISSSCCVAASSSSSGSSRRASPGRAAGPGRPWPSSPACGAAWTSSARAGTAPSPPV